MGTKTHTQMVMESLHEQATLDNIKRTQVADDAFAIHANIEEGSVSSEDLPDCVENLTVVPVLHRPRIHVYYKV